MLFFLIQLADDSLGAKASTLLIVDAQISNKCEVFSVFKLAYNWFKLPSPVEFVFSNLLYHLGIKNKNLNRN